MSQQGSAASIQITSASRSFLCQFRDLWQHREVLYFLAWRDVRLRYRHAAFGVLWLILQPAVNMAVVSLLFGRYARLPSNGMPYPLFLLAALLPWQFASHAVGQSSTSLVTNESIIQKVYVPKIVMPVAALLATLVDLMISLGLLLMILPLAGVPLQWRILVLPGYIFLAVVFLLGAGTCLSALDALYRDVRVMLPFALQLWFFVTPILYPVSMLPEPWRMLSGLNPMAVVVEGFRWALLDGPAVPLSLLLMSVVSTGGCLLLGMIVFNRIESGIVDAI